VEVLTPDFHADPAKILRVVAAGPEVFNHNMETVRRLSKAVRPQAGYERSLEVLRIAKSQARRPMKTKSGLMVGLGEKPQEVRQLLVDLRQTGCDFLTIGQYLRPTPAHQPVSEYVTLERFSLYREWAGELGFSFIASAPYVRSSYNAHEALSPSFVGQV
jgi:lipoyl synthase